MKISLTAKRTEFTDVQKLFLSSFFAFFFHQPSGSCENIDSLRLFYCTYLSPRGVTIISARLILSSCRESLSILIENLHKVMFTNSPFRLIKLPNNRLLEEQQFFVYSHIFLIIFSQNPYNFLPKMSALNKTENQI